MKPTAGFELVVVPSAEAGYRFDVGVTKFENGAKPLGDVWKCLREYKLCF